MFVIQKDMKDLKEKGNAERLKVKMDARIIHLEKERNWFRDEALQLSQMNKDHKKLAASLKIRLESETDEKEILQKKLVKTELKYNDLMYEFDYYKQQYGENIDLIQALSPSQQLGSFEGYKKTF